MNKKNFVAIVIFCVPMLMSGCIDDSPVEYNEYDIKGVRTPVDKSGNNEKKVYIGHDLPVNVTLNAKYDEEDIPIQVYLLHAEDVEEVENGIGYIGDIRMYYCHRTEKTTIDKIEEGENTYGIVINIPAEDSKDELTEDFKTGTFYVVAEVNKYEDAEIDAFAVYEKFRDDLTDPIYREQNQIVVASEFTSKPDLSVESMSFTGGSDDPEDVLVWYNVDLTGLPGINNAGLDPEDMIILVEPSEKDRTFTGTVNVKSSASDALNVPIQFFLKDEAETIEVALDIYDKSIGGWVDKYYIPLLKANTTERVTLGLRIPEEKGMENNFFSDYEAWPSNPYTDCDDLGCTDTDTYADCYPLSLVRHVMGKTGYGNHSFKIVAEVNPGGEVTESRFIKSNDTNTAYTENDYYETGDVYENDNSPSITKENNTKSESLTFYLEKVEVSPNEGIKVYPFCKIEDPEDTSDDETLEPYRTIAIFWDGFEFNVGDSTFGANAEAHEGMFFYNYSLYSLGCHVSGTVFKNTLYLVNTHLNAQSHPFDANSSGFEFHIEGGQKVVLSEAGDGHSDNTWEYPILLWSKEKSWEKWYYCFKFTLTAGIETWFTPGVHLGIYEDGSLAVDKYASLRASVYADASASIAGLATVGLYTYLDVLTLSLIQSCYTTAEYDEANFPGRVKGTLNRQVGVYLIGPKGYIDLYFEIDFIFFSKRWSFNIFSFTSFTIPLLEMDFAGSGEYTYWNRLQNPSLALDTSNTE